MPHDMKMQVAPKFRADHIAARERALDAAIRSREVPDLPAAALRSPVRREPNGVRARHRQPVPCAGDLGRRRGRSGPGHEGPCLRPRVALDPRAPQPRGDADLRRHRGRGLDRRPLKKSFS